MPLDNFLSAEILSFAWSSQTPSWKGEIESSWIGEGIKLEVPTSLRLQEKGTHFIFCQSPFTKVTWPIFEIKCIVVYKNLSQWKISILCTLLK